MIYNSSTESESRPIKRSKSSIDVVNKFPLMNTTEDSIVSCDELDSLSNKIKDLSIDKEKRKMTFEDIHEDVIRIIFNLLDQQDCINFCFSSKFYKHMYSNHCKSIKLKINENNFKDSMKQFLSLSSIANNIEELEIRGTSSYDIILDDYILHFLKRHKSLKTIRLYYLTIKNPLVLIKIFQNKTLEKVVYHNNTFSEWSKLKYIKCPSVKCVDIADHENDGIDVEKLINIFTDLEKIRVEIKRSSPLKHISKFTNLKVLRVHPVYSNDHVMMDDLLKSFSNLKNLNDLMIGGVDDNTIQDIAKLTNLQKLNLIDSPRMGSQGLQTIGSNLTNLEELKLSFGLFNGFNLTEDHMLYLRPLRRLRILEMKIKDCDASAIERFLVKNMPNVSFNIT